MSTRQTTGSASQAMPPPPPPPLLPTDGSTGAQSPAASNGGLTGAGAVGNTGDVSVRTCSICSSSSHLKRHCPQVTCAGCGRLGHFRQDCPQQQPSVQSAEAEAEETHTSVCRACGSSRHIQAHCPARLQTVECYQCHQRGHIMTMCPYTRCYNCGTYGHSSQVCHSKPHCFHCSNAGHRSSECPIKYKGRVCYQCKEPGHEAANCPQGQLCRMCHQPGHLVARCPEVECNTCHEKGHTSGVCDKVLCANCGGTHDTTVCRSPGWQYSYNSYQEGFEEAEEAMPGPPEQPQEAVAAHTDPAVKDALQEGTQPLPPTSVGGEVAGSGEAPAPPIPVGTHTTPVSPMSAARNTTRNVAVTAVPPYVPTGEPRQGRVAVVIDGPYFERCVRSSGSNPHHTAEYYTRATEALRHTLQYLGDIFAKEPIAFWFDTDPSAFTEFLETAMPLAHRESAFRETAMRKKYLTDEMNGDRALPNVVARLVGGMKRQYGYTRDGPGYVWVQTGVDVAISTAVIEHFHDAAQYQQVVLLCGDSDVYPAVHYCNSLRRRMQGAAAGGVPNPVRVCGTSTSMSKLYGQHQDLSDFLPRILLDRPSHSEQGRKVDFPPSCVFS